MDRLKIIAHTTAGGAIVSFGITLLCLIGAGVDYIFGRQVALFSWDNFISGLIVVCFIFISWLIGTVFINKK